MEENKEDSVYVDQEQDYGVKTKAVPKEPRKIGIDVNGDFVDNVIEAGSNGQIDMSKLQSFLQVSQERDQLYKLLDTMSDDPTISAVLETYAEDSTETNDNGRIVWCESDDDKVNKFVTYILDTMEVDKHIYKWTHSLCKYGDVYLRLYRKSEFNDALFSKTVKKEDKENLNEDVNIKLFAADDKYEHYVEQVPNPAEMFELTKFGKSYAYIQAKTPTQRTKKVDGYANSSFLYTFNRRDIDVYDATTFVHASLEDNSSRTPEEVEIFLGDDEDETQKLSYTVRRGQSLLYNTFKIWRELMLLENSLLLNRLTKSSILRTIQVEVGDMPKENVAVHMNSIKNLIEQKTALNINNSLQEYTNPGPMENTIYIPTRNQIGTINAQQIGGDVDIKSISDIDYFEDKLFGALRVPKQYFGRTDENAGFSGGESLAIISSRYAKMVKRVQNTMVQAITDIINLMLIDKGLDSYINKFTIHMLPPTTSEEKDRRDNMTTRVQMIRDVMDLVADIEDESAKLEILKTLLSGAVNEPEIISVIQEQIDKLEEQEKEGVDTTPTSGSNVEIPTDNEPSPSGSLSPSDIEGNEQASNEQPEENNGEEQILPTPSDLGIDFGNNDNPEFEQ